MDPGYLPSNDISQQGNYADSSGQLFVPHDLFEHSESSMSTESPQISSSSELDFSFDISCQTSQGASPSALIDCTIFETPVDITFGILPPRPANSRALAQGRIPRPRNAFMLFRSAFHRERRVAQSVEKDHRHISRIIGICWSSLSEAEKNVWRQRAELEKQQHAIAYPSYRFKPTPRTKQPVKRNVKRNTPQEIERCKKIAKLIRDGKSGEELTRAVETMEGDISPTSPGPGRGTVSSGREQKRSKRQKASLPTNHPVPQFPQAQYQAPSIPLVYETADDSPPFRSPLLPPIDLPQQQAKRPYSTLTVELTPQAPPVTTSHQPGSFDDLYFSQTYTTQESTFRDSQRGLRYRQRLQQQQREQGQALEWLAKDLNVDASYDDATPKQQYVVLDISHHTDYPPFSPGCTAYDSYLSEDELGQSPVDWNTVTYCQNDSDRAFAGVPVPMLANYESWSKSDDSVSPVHSDSPITPL